MGHGSVVGLVRRSSVGRARRRSSSFASHVPHNLDLHCYSRARARRPLPSTVRSSSSQSVCWKRWASPLSDEAALRKSWKRPIGGCLFPSTDGRLQILSPHFLIPSNKASMPKLALHIFLHMLWLAPVFLGVGGFPFPSPGRLITSRSTSISMSKFQAIVEISRRKPQQPTQFLLGIDDVSFFRHWSALLYYSLHKLKRHLLP